MSLNPAVYCQRMDTFSGVSVPCIVCYTHVPGEIYRRPATQVFVVVPE